MLRNHEFAKDVVGIPEQVLAALKSEINYAATGASCSELMEY
ncbi:hypothetical protein [Zhongshania sp.]|jgi:hypothetical protein